MSDSFSEGDVSLLTALGVQQGTETSQLAEWAPHEPSTNYQGMSLGLFQALVEELPDGLLVCDQQLRLILLNHAARVALAAGRGFALIEEGRGACRLRPLANERRFLQAANAAVELGYRSLVALDESGQTDHAAVVPLGAAGSRVVLIRLSRTQVCTEITLELFGKAHGLTPSERRVTKGLVSGHRPSEMAYSFGVEISTIRTQIGAIRAKLGAKNIGEVSQRVARLPVIALALRQGQEIGVPC